MRKISTLSKHARALDEITFQASLYALLTAVRQLERREDSEPDVRPLEPVRVNAERLPE
jgi:hypothetical protein